MEPIKRKFKCDVSTNSINKLLEKRQRKRFYRPPADPLGTGSRESPKSSSWPVKPLGTKIGGQITVITKIPMEPRNMSSLEDKWWEEKKQKPENWVMPERVTKTTDSIEAEKERIAKTLGARASWSRSVRMHLKATGQKVQAPASNLTAKGYLSRRTTSKDQDSERVGNESKPAGVVPAGEP